MKFEAGDRVRVKENLEIGKEYGCQRFVERMDHLRGQIVTIKRVHRYGYKINNSQENWTDEMFEEIKAEPKWTVKSMEAPHLVPFEMPKLSESELFHRRHDDSFLTGLMPNRELSIWRNTSEADLTFGRSSRVKKEADRKFWEERARATSELDMAKILEDIKAPTPEHCITSTPHEFGQSTIHEMMTRIMKPRFSIENKTKEEFKMVDNFEGGIKVEKVDNGWKVEIDGEGENVVFVGSENDMDIEEVTGKAIREVLYRLDKKKSAEELKVRRLEEAKASAKHYNDRVAELEKELGDK